MKYGQAIKGTMEVDTSEGSCSVGSLGPEYRVIQEKPQQGWSNNLCPCEVEDESIGPMVALNRVVTKNFVCTFFKLQSLHTSANAMSWNIR